MSWKMALCLSPIFTCSAMHALIEQQIDEKKPIELVFSTSSHNRISVEDGGVEKVFGDESYFNINIDRATGNAFVNVLRDITEHPSTLTVVTSSGFIQDLSVSSSDKPSEHLILKDVREEEELIETTSNFHVHTVEVLNKILEGKIPLGYGQKTASDGETINLPYPLVASFIKAFEGPFEEIMVYSIKNVGKHPIVIDADTIKKEKASWVFLNAHELKAKEQVVCIVSFPKNEH